jgi:hypothetical protein
MDRWALLKLRRFPTAFETRVDESDGYVDSTVAL